MKKTHQDKESKMSKEKTTTPVNNGTKKAESHQIRQATPTFFEQKPTRTLRRKEPTELELFDKKITLQSNSDLLLAAILQELKTQNTMKYQKQLKQQEKEQRREQAEEEMQTRDNARFEAVRSSLYS